MKNLINIQENNLNSQVVKTANARELHIFLESKQDFSTWIKKRINEYEFVENVDFVTLHKKMEREIGATMRVEYYISLDMAKELSMVERNQKGKEARQYFIECERVAKDPMQMLNDPNAMRGLLLTYSEKVIGLENKVAEIQPKADALDRLIFADGAMNLTNSAKHLQVRPGELIGWLSANRYIYKRVGGKSWVAYQDRIQSGILTHKVTIVQREDGTEKVCEQVLVTAKGLSILAQKRGLLVA